MDPLVLGGEVNKLHSQYMFGQCLSEVCTVRLTYWYMKLLLVIHAVSSHVVHQGFRRLQQRAIAI